MQPLGTVVVVTTKKESIFWFCHGACGEETHGGCNDYMCSPLTCCGFYFGEGIRADAGAVNEFSCFPVYPPHDDLNGEICLSQMVDIGLQDWLKRQPKYSLFRDALGACTYVSGDRTTQTAIVFMQTVMQSPGGARIGEMHFSGREVYRKAAKEAAAEDKRQTREAIKRGKSKKAKRNSKGAAEGSKERVSSASTTEIGPSPAGRKEEDESSSSDHEADYTHMTDVSSSSESGEESGTEYSGPLPWSPDRPIHEDEC